MILTTHYEGKKNDYNLPIHWNDVMLGQFQEIQKIERQKNTIGDIERMIKIICILCDMPEKEANRIPIDSIMKIQREIEGLLKEEPNAKLHNIIKMDGVEYGFHPNLSQMTLGEYVDLETYSKENATDNLHKLIALLYRPIVKKKGDKYAIEKYEDYDSESAEKIFLEKFNVDWLTGASVFFLNFGEELRKNIATYSPILMKHLKKKVLTQTSLEGGVGTK